MIWNRQRVLYSASRDSAVVNLNTTTYQSTLFNAHYLTQYVF